MAAPATTEDFLDIVRRSGVVDDEKLRTFLSGSAPPASEGNPQATAQRMIRDGLITPFQAKQLLVGKHKRFIINGKYKLLDLIGAGGMGTVYLCEHIYMHRLVALKVLPTDKLDDPSAVERFYREARAVAALDHPNIVRAYDVDRDEKLHYLVMEFIDGASLQAIVANNAPLSPLRAAHYMHQAALGLQHAHEAGLIHRDIKPGNLLLDRSGTVKILDLGLARFFDAPKKDSVTEKYDENSVMGTADYLSPEQANNTLVDIRADIYSLGGTFYYLLTGKAPFEDGTISQKLIGHQIKEPPPISSVRKDVPPGLIRLVAKMMAKDPADRFQTPLELAIALDPFSAEPIDPPTAAEMPKHAPVVASSLTSSGSGVSALRSGSGSLPGTPSPKGRLAGPVTHRKQSQPLSGPTTPRPAGVRGIPTKKMKVAPVIPHWLILAVVGGVGGLLALAAGAFTVIKLFSPAPATPPRVAVAPPTPAVKSKPTPAPTPAPKSANLPTIKADDALDHLNETCVVELTVLSSGAARTGNLVFLNSRADYRDAKNLSLTIATRYLDKFRAQGISDPQSHYKNKRLRVRGTITVYNKQAQLEIDDPAQIEIVGGS